MRPFYSVEGCTEWYLDEIYESAKDGELGDASERYDQMAEWYNDLDASDKAKADRAADKWLENHPSASMYL